MFKRGQVELCMQMRREEKYFSNARRHSILQMKPSQPDTLTHDNSVLGAHIMFRSVQTFDTLNEVTRDSSVSWAIQNPDSVSPSRSTFNEHLNLTCPTSRHSNQKEECDSNKNDDLRIDDEFDALLVWEEINSASSTNYCEVEPAKDCTQRSSSTLTSAPSYDSMRTTSSDHDLINLTPLPAYIDTKHEQVGYVTPIQLNPSAHIDMNSNA